MLEKIEKQLNPLNDLVRNAWQKAYEQGIKDGYKKRDDELLEEAKKSQAEEDKADEFEPMSPKDLSNFYNENKKMASFNS